MATTHAHKPADVKVPEAPAPEAPAAEATGNDKPAAEKKREYKRTDVSMITIDLASADTDAFGTDETVGVLIDPETRSDVQKHFDAQVKASYDAWVAGGKPTWFQQNQGGRIVLCPGAHRIFVDPSTEPAYRSLLASAAKFNGVGLRVLPVQQHKSGRKMLPWVARDLQKRSRKTAENKPDAAATPAKEPSAEARALAEKIAAGNS